MEGIQSTGDEREGIETSVRMTAREEEQNLGDSTMKPALPEGRVANDGDEILAEDIPTSQHDAIEQSNTAEYSGQVSHEQDPSSKNTGESFEGSSPDTKPTSVQKVLRWFWKGPE